MLSSVFHPPPLSTNSGHKRRRTTSFPNVTHEIKNWTGTRRVGPGLWKSGGKKLRTVSANVYRIFEILSPTNRRAIEKNTRRRSGENVGRTADNAPRTIESNSFDLRGSAESTSPLICVTPVLICPRRVLTVYSACGRGRTGPIVAYYCKPRRVHGCADYPDCRRMSRHSYTLS